TSRRNSGRRTTGARTTPSSASTIRRAGWAISTRNACSTSRSTPHEAPALASFVAGAGLRRLARCRRASGGALGAGRLARCGGAIGRAALARRRFRLTRQRFLRCRGVAFALERTFDRARALARRMLRARLLRRARIAFGLLARSFRRGAFL